MFETFSLPVLAALSVFAKGPHLQELGPDGVTIRFELASAGPATVEVEALTPPHDAGPAPKKQTDDASTTFHAVRITGLAPATAYRYVARAAGASERGTFTTAPEVASAAPFRFVVYGDTRTDPAAHAAVVRAIVAEPSDFAVNTGDFVEDGASPEDWQSFFDIERGLLRDRCVFA